MKVKVFSYYQWLGVEMLLENFLQFCKKVFALGFTGASRLRSSAYVSPPMAVRRTGTMFMCMYVAK